MSTGHSEPSARCPVTVGVSLLPGPQCHLCPSMGLALVVSPPDSQALLCIRGQGSHLRCSLQAVSPPTPAPHCDLALCLLCSTLCDNLRRERDRAVSELAEALRSLDDTRKQKNDVSRELKELKYAGVGAFWAELIPGSEMPPSPLRARQPQVQSWPSVPSFSLT